MVAPNVKLWTPKYRAGAGFGSGPLETASLVLQCSMADDRLQGPSTRVTRSVVESYMAEDLAEWHGHIRFVLIGAVDDTAAAERFKPTDLGPEGAPRFEPVLFTIGLFELWAFVRAQGRGTVSFKGLDHLRTMPAATGEGAAAEPLRDTIARFAAPGAFEAIAPSPPAALRPDPHLDWWRDPFRRPMPIALRFAAPR